MIRRTGLAPWGLAGRGDDSGGEDVHIHPRVREGVGEGGSGGGRGGGGRTSLSLTPPADSANKRAQVRQGFEAGSHLRRIDSCITQLTARTCNES